MVLVNHSGRAMPTNDASEANSVHAQSEPGMNDVTMRSANVQRCASSIMRTSLF